MTVESNYVFAITTLSDWLKRLALVFLTNEEQNQNESHLACTRDFSSATSELQIIARNCDWFIALFVPVVIGGSYCLRFSFSTVI